MAKAQARSVGPVRLLASLLCLLSSAGWAATTQKNLDGCNGKDGTPALEQIAACTAIIDANVESPRTLAIAHNNRGTAQASLGKYDLAIGDFDTSIKLNPRYFRAFNNRGVALKKKGDFDRAIKDFDAALAIDPSYTVALANRGDAYAKKLDFRHALQDFDEAIKREPAMASLWNERCWVRAQSGAPDAALNDCNEAIKLGPNAARYDSRGFTNLKLGRWQAAVGDFDSALRLNPRLASSLYGRGFAKLKAGDQSGGNADIAAARAIRQDIAQVYAGYGLQ
jgi:tetratricopeptide (TPR) repeat protein